MKHYDTNFNYWNSLIKDKVNGEDIAVEQILTIATALANHIKLKDHNPNITDLKWNFDGKQTKNTNGTLYS